jgi:hypothetical protein
MGSNQKDSVSSFSSKWINNEMHGIGQFEWPKIGTIKYKVRFFKITKNSYEWEQHLSKDGGKNWFLDLRQIAKRRITVVKN